MTGYASLGRSRTAALPRESPGPLSGVNGEIRLFLLHKAMDLGVKARNNVLREDSQSKEVPFRRDKVGGRGW